MHCVCLPACTYQSICNGFHAWQLIFLFAVPHAAVVTCGGLCPGLNDVVQGLVSKLTDYGVPEGNIIGIRCGTSTANWVHSHVHIGCNCCW